MRWYYRTYWQIRPRWLRHIYRLLGRMYYRCVWLPASRLTEL